MTKLNVIYYPDNRLERLNKTIRTVTSLADSLAKSNRVHYE